MPFIKHLRTWILNSTEIRSKVSPSKPKTTHVPRINYILIHFNPRLRSCTHNQWGVVFKRWTTTLPNPGLTTTTTTTNTNGSWLVLQIIVIIKRFFLPLFICRYNFHRNHQTHLRAVRNLIKSAIQTASSKPIAHLRAWTITHYQARVSRTSELCNRTASSCSNFDFGTVEKRGFAPQATNPRPILERAVRKEKVKKKVQVQLNFR